MKNAGILALTLLFLIFGAGSHASTFDDLRREQVDTYNQEQKTLTLTAVGDIMFHMPQVDSAKGKGEGAYGFERWFTYLTPWFKTRDFVIGNLETTLSATGPYRGYPAFKSPSEAAFDLADSGFNVLTTANNHSYDTGFAGVVSTLENLDAAGIQHTGTFSKAGQKPYILLEKKGYKTALLAYTYSTNGITIPADKSFAVNLMDRDRIKRDLAALPKDIDFTIVSLHFGNEYQRKPSAHQMELVAWLKTQAVDVVLGSHPHVLQEDALTEARDFYVIYSMGNFISNQRERYKDSGVLVNINLSKIDGVKKIQVSLIPTWVDKDTEYRIIPLNDRFLSSRKHIIPADLALLNQSKNDFYDLFKNHTRH